MRITTSCVAVVVLALCGVVYAGDWRQWRGDNNTGVASQRELPVKWSEKENVRWAADLPGRGLSSPVVADGRIFLTASSGTRGERLHVLGFDARTGRQLWHRQFWATGGTMCHPKTCMAAPTPATDGKYVYALFATCDLFCIDRDGTLVWCRSLIGDYPAISNQVGMASSPVLVDGVLAFSLETDAESAALGVDAQTGVNRWKVPRSTAINWVSPLVLRRGSVAEVVMQSGDSITAYDPRTGEARWSHVGEFVTIPSPTTDGESIFAPGTELVALRPDPARRAPSLLWSSNKLRTQTASPIAYQGRLYTINSAGVVSCCDIRDGNLLWQERLKGPFSASPVAGDNKLYFVNEEGVTSVIDVTRRENRIVAANPLGESVLASPAVIDGGVLLRSDKRLVCVGVAQ